MKRLIVIILLMNGLMASNFTLMSESLQGQLTKVEEFNGFGCSGANISPELHWSKPPSQTKSFALTMYDPDAPTGSGWWHWIAVNIPSFVKKLDAGISSTDKLPKEVIEIINDFGTKGFGGACPPAGDKRHMYIFTLHALDVEKLEVTPKTNRAIVGYMINHHSIGKTSLVSYYKR